VLENRVLRKIFGSKRDEVIGEWRKLHNEELRDFYCSPSIVPVIRAGILIWVGQLTHTGKMIGACRDLT
jgi:hypothetical protein